MADIKTKPCRVFIDGCAVNRFALLNLDPAKALAGSAFTLAITPDLEAEYARALDHLFVPPYVKALVRSLLDRMVRVEAPEAGITTDSHLVALARSALVVSDDAALIRATDAPGMIAWAEIEAAWRAERPLLDLFRERAAMLDIVCQGSNTHKNDA